MMIRKKSKQKKISVSYTAGGSRTVEGETSIGNEDVLCYKLTGKYTAEELISLGNQLKENEKAGL